MSLLYLILILTVYSTITTTVDSNGESAKDLTVPEEGCTYTPHCHVDYALEKIHATVKINYNHDNHDRQLYAFKGSTPLKLATKILTALGIDRKYELYETLLWHFIDGIGIESKNARIVSIYGTNDDTIGTDKDYTKNKGATTLLAEFHTNENKTIELKRFFDDILITQQCDPENQGNGKHAAAFKYYGIQVFNGFHKMLYEKHRMSNSFSKSLEQNNESSLEYAYFIAYYHLFSDYSTNSYQDRIHDDDLRNENLAFNPMNNDLYHRGYCSPYLACPINVPIAYVEIPKAACTYFKTWINGFDDFNDDEWNGHWPSTRLTCCKYGYGREKIAILRNPFTRLESHFNNFVKSKIKTYNIFSEGRSNAENYYKSLKNVTHNQAKQMIITPPNNQTFMSNDDFEYWVISLFRILKENPWSKDVLRLSHTGSMTNIIKNTLIATEMPHFDIMNWKFIALETLYSEYNNSFGIWQTLRNDLCNKYNFCNEEKIDLLNVHEMKLLNEKQNLKYDKKLSYEVEQLIFNHYKCDFLLGNYLMDSAKRVPLKRSTAPTIGSAHDKNNKLLLLYLCFDGKTDYSFL